LFLDHGQVLGRQPEPDGGLAPDSLKIGLNGVHPGLFPLASATVKGIEAFGGVTGRVAALARGIRRAVCQALRPGLPLPLDKNFMLKNFVHSSQIVKSHATVDGRAAIELS
jgi:hypothetical protein